MGRHRNIPPFNSIEWGTKGALSLVISSISNDLVKPVFTNVLKDYLRKIEPILQQLNSIDPEITVVATKIVPQLTIVPATAFPAIVRVSLPSYGEIRSSRFSNVVFELNLRRQTISNSKFDIEIPVPIENCEEISNVLRSLEVLREQFATWHGQFPLDSRGADLAAYASPIIRAWLARYDWYPKTFKTRPRSFNFKPMSSELNSVLTVAYNIKTN